MFKGPQHKNVWPKGDGRRREGRRSAPEQSASGEWPQLSYRELVERVPAVLYLDASDEASSAIYISPQGESMLGYSREEWLEDPELWVKILHPGDRERVLAEHLRAKRSGGPFEVEYRLVARDGSVVWVRDEAASGEDDVGDSRRRAGVLLDVTERREAEEALRRSEERFRLVARATGEAIWDNDLLTGKQEWDGATEALFGYPPRRGRTGAWWEERIHPEDRDRVLRGLKAVYEGGGEAWSEEYRFRRADGSYAHVADRGFVARNREGTPVRMVGAMSDVTARRRHEEELRRSEEMFRTTFEAAAVGMAHVALDGAWLRVNEKLCEISGYRREELLGLNFLDLTLPEDRGASLERFRRLLSGEIGPYSIERRYVRKNGSRVWVNLAVSLVRKGLSGEPNYFICVAEDITERKLEELLPDPLTSGEMDVLYLMILGQTNREIAKELRYSVSTINSRVGYILHKLKVDNRREAARRAVEIGLLSF